MIKTAQKSVSKSILTFREVSSCIMWSIHALNLLYCTKIQQKEDDGTVVTKDMLINKKVKMNTAACLLVPVCLFVCFQIMVYNLRICWNACV